MNNALQSLKQLNQKLRIGQEIENWCGNFNFQFPWKHFNIWFHSKKERKAKRYKSKTRFNILRHLESEWSLTWNSRWGEARTSCASNSASCLRSFSMFFAPPRPRPRHSSSFSAWRIESRREEAEVFRDTRLAGRDSLGSLLGSSTIRICKMRLRIFFPLLTELFRQSKYVFWRPSVGVERGFIQRFSHKSPNLIWSKPGFEFLPRQGRARDHGWCTYSD